MMLRHETRAHTAGVTVAIHKAIIQFSFEIPNHGRSFKISMPTFHKHLHLSTGSVKEKLFLKLSLKPILKAVNKTGHNLEGFHVK